FESCHASSSRRRNEMEKKEKRYRNPAQRRGIQKMLIVKVLDRQNKAKKASQLFIVNKCIKARY
ncbi:MAG: hypothetical protein NE327_04225, partial [Lentisphaeraceae bacterium]|nr:hypothetical protein [Lentisphaeraceae bacterium]